RHNLCRGLRGPGGLTKEEAQARRADTTWFDIPHQSKLSRWRNSDMECCLIANLDNKWNIVWFCFTSR
ncbi:MAG: hypothetical protein ACKN82_06020, partial [Pirellula sp.]